MVDYSGQILNERYLVEKLVGKGGMGSVYKGRHVLIGKEVAVKFLHPQFVTQESTVSRFYREAKAAAAIVHKNVIDILDVGVSSADDPYIVMEYLEGESLDVTMQREGTLPLETACSIMEPVLSALSAAHKKGIVHRDLKPDNIFLADAHADDGTAATVKLIDFGVSKSLGAEDALQLTQTGAIIGTPAYMAPEQIENPKGVDHRIDIYSAGVIFFRLLTGEWPYDAESRDNLIAMILSAPPRSPLELNPNISREALPVINRALHRDVKERYQTADEMLAEIRRIGNPDARTSHLSGIVSTIQKPQCVLGDIGERVAVDESIPKRVLSGVVRQEMSQTGAALEAGFRGPGFPETRRRRLLPAAGISAVLLLGGAAVYAFFFASPEVNTTEVNTAPIVKTAEVKTPKDVTETVIDEAVEIRLLGIPSTSKIFWNDREVKGNPFSVPLGEASRPLRIEAAGYVSFNAEVTPSANRIIEVHLLAAEAPKDNASRSRHTPRKRPSKTSGDTQPKQSDGRGSAGSDDITFKQGKKGTKIVETFR